MKRSIDKKLAVKKPLRPLSGADLRRVVGGAYVGDVDGSGWLAASRRSPSRSARTPRSEWTAGPALTAA